MGYFETRTVQETYILVTVGAAAFAFFTITDVLKILNQSRTTVYSITVIR